MAESSRFWNTNNIGDGVTAGFGRAMIAAWLQQIFARGGHGVLQRALNDLAVSGSTSPLSLASGAALVDGIFYSNSAALNLAVTTPVVGTTGGRVILRANWTAQTVRAAILLSADGTPGRPALTQTPGTTYEFGLASFQIETGGSIINLTTTATWAIFSNNWQIEQLILAGVSVMGNSGSSTGAGEDIAAASDGQVLRRNGSDLEFGQIATAGIANDAVTIDKIADDAVGASQIADDAVGADQIADDAVDDLRVGNRVPQFYRRQGGSATSWASQGTTEYTPGTVRMQGGAYSMTISNGSVYAGEDLITMPFSFSNTPICFAVVVSTTTEPVIARCHATANNKIAISLLRTGTSGALTVTVNWFAVGPQ